MNMKSLSCAASLTLVGLLAGCAGSQAPQYYSLQAIPVMAEAPVPPVNAAYAISMQPVVIPQQVARPQIVVQATPGAEVVPLNSSLWASPLESQIRDVLSGELSRRLGVMDVGQSGAADAMPVWRIYVDVQRFDSLYDRSVKQEVVWRMVPQGMPRVAKERVCSAQIQRPVGAGMSALVEGHRQALESLAALMAQVVPPAPAAGGRGTAGKGGAAAGAMAAPAVPQGVQFRGCVG